MTLTLTQWQVTASQYHSQKDLRNKMQALHFTEEETEAQRGVGLVQDLPS
jgi:hypothetical protein